jgi:hypothetical protein
MNTKASQQCRCDGNYYLEYSYNEMTENALDIINQIETQHLLNICWCEKNNNNDNASPSNTQRSHHNQNISLPSYSDDDEFLEIQTTFDLEASLLTAVNRDDQSRLRHHTSIRCERRPSTLAVRLEAAEPHTLLYRQIINSTPFIAANILTENLMVDTTTVSYMQPLLDTQTLTYHAKRDFP